MRSPGINGIGELRGQLANRGSPGKMAVKMGVCVCVCVCVCSEFIPGYARSPESPKEERLSTVGVRLYTGRMSLSSNKQCQITLRCKQ